MPNNSAFGLQRVLSRSSNPKVLVMSAKLFDSSIKDNEVVYQFKEALLVTHLCKSSVQGIGVFIRWLFPGEVVLLLRLNSSVAQTFCFISCHDPRDRRKEVLYELGFLVI